MTTPGYSVSCTLGKATAGEKDAIFTPRVPRRGSRGVLLCHGAGYGVDEWYDLATNPASVAIAAALASAGLTCLASDFGQGTWGNATGVARLDAGATYLKTLPNVAQDKVLILGVSMGNQNAVQYAINHPTNVAAVVGIMGVSSVNDFYVNNRGTGRTGIENAWGVTYPTPLPAQADTSLNNNWLPAVGIPYRNYHSTADTTVPAVTVDDLAAKLGGESVVVSTTLDHSDALVASVPIPDLIAFLTSHA
jgi:pimeloyl-ACP methyl ester carboxylesterase